MIRFKLTKLAILFFISANSYSQEQFTRHYGEFTGHGRSLIINSDENFVIAGQSSGESTIYIIDELGDVLLNKVFYSNSLDWTNQVIQTDDEGYLLVGSTLESGSLKKKILARKITNTGEVIWSKKIGDSETAFTSSVCQLSSGEYMLASSITDDTGENFDFWLLKLGLEGELIWDKRYGGEGNDQASSMEQTLDGGFILSGYSENVANGTRDFFLVKTDIHGEIEWSKHYGGLFEGECRKVRHTVAHVSSVR